jgi:hypothetical protein
MPEMFQLDKRELDQLLKFYKQAPRKFLPAAAGMLNTFAFGVREQAIREINDKLTVRNPAFVKSSLRVEKTRIVPLQNMESKTGSIQRGTPGKGTFFSGWIEQETGQQTKRKRVQTLSARQGSWANQVQNRSRLKSNQKFTTFSDFSGKNLGRSKEQRTVAMLESFRKNKMSDSKVMMFRGRLKGRMSKYKRGTYRMQNGVINRHQTFDPRRVQPKRKPWMQPAREQYFKSANMKNLWASQISHVLKNYK